MGMSNNNFNTSIDGRLIQDDYVGQIMSTADDGTPNALFGNFTNVSGTTGAGFKVAASGYDVRYAADQNLYFSSQFNYPKIIQKHEFDYIGTVSGTLFEPRTHGLGYAPAMFMFWSIGFWWEGTDPLAAPLRYYKFTYPIDTFQDPTDPIMIITDQQLLLVDQSPNASSTSTGRIQVPPDLAHAAFMNTYSGTPYYPTSWLDPSEGAPYYSQQTGDPYTADCKVTVWLTVDRS